MNYYFTVLKKYAEFKGRARRAEYWMFFLINIIISFVIGFIETSISGNEESIIGGLYSLALLIPGIAVGVRRLHDTNRSGWWLLIGLVPIIGWILLIVYLAQDSQSGANRFGSNPKEVNGDATVVTSTQTTTVQTTTTTVTPTAEVAASADQTQTPPSISA